MHKLVKFNEFKSRISLLVLVIMILGVPNIYDIFKTYKIRQRLEKFAIEVMNTTSENVLVQNLSQLTNPSFESWHVINNVPEGWSYAQTGGGGGVFKETNAENVKFGLSSAKLVKSNRGSSQLYYTLSDEDAKGLGGKTILFGCWVKSANIISEKISLSVTTLERMVSPDCYYQNTEQWEFIYFLYEIPEDAKAFNLYLDIDSKASADVYFDGAILLY